MEDRPLWSATVYRAFLIDWGAVNKPTKQVLSCGLVIDIRASRNELGHGLAKKVSPGGIGRGGIRVHVQATRVAVQSVSLPLFDYVVKQEIINALVVLFLFQDSGHDVFSEEAEIRRVGDVDTAGDILLGIGGPVYLDLIGNRVFGKVVGIVPVVDCNILACIGL